MDKRQLPNERIRAAAGFNEHECDARASGGVHHLR